MQYNEKVWKGVHRLNGSLAVQSIVPYWAIAFFWEDGAFDFQEITLGLLEEAMLDELFQISSEGPGMNGLVLLTVVERAVLLRPRQ